MNIKLIYMCVSFITIEPSRIVLLRSDWVVVSQGTENSKVPSHEIGRCARVQLSIWPWGRQSEQQMSGLESRVHFLELIKEEIKLTDQKWSREHFGVIGAFPSAVLKMQRQPKDVILWWERVKVQTEASKSRLGSG